MMSTWVLCASILSSSFLGSWHCAGMCGPIASLNAARKQLWSYHVGRGVAYVFLGALCGGVGQFFLQSQFIFLRWVFAVFLAGGIFISGLKLVYPHSTFAQKWPSFTALLSRYKSYRLLHKGKSGFTLGLLTLFLPCGWLYTYAMAAASSQSAWAGALILFLFWLGGLPAMSAAPMMLRQALQAANWRQQKIAGCVLVLASFYSLFSFFFLHF